MSLFKTVIFSFIVFFLLSFNSTFAKADIPAFDQDFICTSNEKADQYTRDFKIDIKSFGGKELCKSNIDTKKLFNDLQIIEQGQFNLSELTTTLATNPLIGGLVDASKYYSWMKDQTEGMNRGNDIPFATAYNSFGYFTMQDGWATLSTLGRVGTVIHEARHTEGFRHIPCVTGPYKDLQLPGCDRNFSYGGSHAVEMEYYARVSLAGENFHPVYKTMARLMAMGRSNFVFNDSPIKKREALLAVSSNGSALLWDQNLVFQKNYFTFNPQSAAVKRTSFGASLFNGLQALALEIYGQGQNSATNSAFISDDYSYYKMLKQDRGQGKDPVLDLEEVDKNQKRFLFYLRNNSYANYNFEGGKFNSPKTINFNAKKFTTTSLDGTEGLFVIDQSNKYYEINLDNPSQIISKGNWDAQTVQYVNWNNRVYRLSTAGKVELWNGQQWTPADLPSLNVLDSNGVANLIKVPLYNAFEVHGQ